MKRGLRKMIWRSEWIGRYGRYIGSVLQTRFGQRLALAVNGFNAGRESMNRLLE
jgi:hypothetical protein